MTRIWAKTTTIAAIALCSGAFATNCGKGSNGDTGHVNVAFSVPGGLTLSSVSYTAQSGATPPATLLTGSINVSDPNATISADLILPAGTGDTLTITGTASPGNVSCTGTSSPFNVVSGQTTSLSMTITCGAGSTGTIPGQVDVNATVISGDNCPSITSGAVAPAVTSVGASIAVSAAASDPDAADVLSYTWTDGVGGPTLATGNATSIACPSSGAHHIILTVADNHTPSCAKSVDLPVNCVATGAGGAAGGAGGSATGGSATGGTGTGGVGTGGVGTGGVGTGGATGGNMGTGGSADTWALCGACELGSSNGNCDPGFLSQDGSGTPFGCDSLPTAQVQACKDLFHCIVTGNGSGTNCSTNGTGTAPGDNPSEGCYCGPAPETASNCITGAGITGVCAAAFHAAAIADTSSGLTAASTEGAFAGYIAAKSFDPSTAVGMADNIATCAIDAPCAGPTQCGGL